MLIKIHYANILRIQEDYAEAQVQYNKYMQLNPTDVNGEMGLKSCAFALKWKDHVLGRGLVHKGTLRTEIPGVRGRWLKKVFAITRSSETGSSD